MTVQWRKCYGFPEYEVSEGGDVRRGGRIKAQFTMKNGYRTVGVSRRDKQLVHRMVALTFIGPPPTPRHQVAHNDGSRGNNHWTNLRWATPAENQADRRRHGTYHAGEACGSARLSDADAQAIRGRYHVGGQRYIGGAITMQALADEYGVSIAQISRIVNGVQRKNGHHRVD